MIDHLSGNLEDVTTVRLREIAAYMREWLPKIEARLRTEDEKELADAKARVAEVEKRIQLSKTGLYATMFDPKPEVAIRPGWNGTDADAGIGNDSAQPDHNLIDELAQLKAHNDEKRARLRARGRQ